MSNDAVVSNVDGYAVVQQADDTIWVHADLWRQIVEGERLPEPDLDHGRSVIDINAGTFAFGTPGRGLGRLTYRFVEHRPDRGVYVYERIPD